MKRLHFLWIPLIFATVSACQSHQASDHATETSTRDAVAARGSPSQPATTASTRSIAETPASREAAPIPKNFSEYASESLSNGQRCVVGATTDDDGMNERAVVYVTDAKSKQPEWVDKFDLPPHTYQSRATHCTRAVGALFVLQQSDTQPEQALSQTLLRVVKLDPVTGAVQKQRDIQVPGAFSVWVTEGSSHFQWSRNALAVSGNERTQAAPDQDVTFTLHMNADLEPISGHRP